jgi:hypothetical protein
VLVLAEQGGRSDVAQRLPRLRGRDRPETASRRRRYWS